MNNTNGSDDRALKLPPSGEAAAYASLSELVYAEQPLADTLAKLTALAKQVLTEAPEVSLTLIDDDRTVTAAYTASLALQLDERQYDTGTGPCLDAAHFGEAVSLTMADPDQLYPDFRNAAQHDGVSHTLSIGFPVGNHALGALNIYNSTGRPFSQDSDRIARTVATCVGVVLASVDRYRRTATLAAQLGVALHSRACIDQAKGILIARHGCSSDDAFKILTRQSQKQNVKLRQVAQDLVDEAVRA